MGKIFIIMGPGGSGKDTVKEVLLEKLKQKNYKLELIVPYTTRPMRNGEQMGREYFFINEKEMNKLEHQNKIIEKRSYNTVNGIWHYFTTNENIDLSKNYINIATLEAYRQFVQFYGEEVVIPLYIYISKLTRLKRTIKREKTQSNPNYSELIRRYIADSDDFSKDNFKKNNITEKYDNNGSIEDCVAQIEKTLSKYL